MTTRRLIAAGVVLIVAALAVNTYIGIRNHDEATAQHRRELEQHRREAAAARAQAERDCRNQAAIARAVRANLQRGEAQGKALVKSGVTFGIPRARLDKLIAQNEESDRKYLAELDGLARGNCEVGRAPPTPRAKPQARAGANPSPLAAPPALPSTSTAPGRARERALVPTVRSLPERRRSQRPSAPTITSPPVPPTPPTTATTMPSASSPAPAPVTPTPPPTISPPKEGPLGTTCLEPLGVKALCR